MSTTELSAAKPRRDPYQIFLSVISMALAVLVVLLVLQNRGLKQRIEALQSAPPPGGPKAGDTMAPFTVVDASGAPVQIAVGDGKPRVVLVFTSVCPHCLKAFPIWRDLLRENAEGIEVVGLQVDAGKGGAARLDTLPFPVYSPADPPPDFVRGMSVPTTILVEGSGEIEQVILGPPEGKAAEDLVTALVKARG